MLEKILQNICNAKYAKSNKWSEKWNKQNKHFSNSVDIFKSTKNILEKLKTKEDSSNPTTSRFKQNS